MATIKAEYYRLNGAVWDKYYFKTTTDMVENFKADSAVPLGSHSDFVNGTLILTDISSADGPSWRIEVMGKPYTAISTPIHFTIESYNYDNQFYAPASKGLSYGYRMPTVTILDYEGKVAIWFPRLGYWNSFIATAYETIDGGYIRNRVISYLDIAKPTSTKTREVVLEQLASESWSLSNLVGLTGNQYIIQGIKRFRDLAVYEEGGLSWYNGNIESKANIVLVNGKLRIGGGASKSGEIAVMSDIPTTMAWGNITSKPTNLIRQVSFSAGTGTMVIEVI